MKAGNPWEIQVLGRHGLDYSSETFANTGLSTYRPYKIKDKDIMVLGRNAMVSQQVWSADFGYPGDEYYREFHKESSRSGFKYWRVTDRKHSFDKKLPYQVDKAMLKVSQHGRHFVKSLEQTGHEAQKTGFSQPYDCGLL